MQTVEFLTPVQHLQKRSSMYLDTSSPQGLLKEMCDNSTDECLNEYANRIEIKYTPDCYLVRDNGRGLPLYPVKSFGNQIAAKLLFLELFSGGKFSIGLNYKFSSGTHGIGLSCVGALSKCVKVSVNSKEENKQYDLTLENGIVTQEVFSSYNPKLWFTTEIVCYPNEKYFRSSKVNLDLLSLQLTKKLFPKSQISVNGKEIQSFSFQNVIVEKLLGDYVFHCGLESGTIKFDLYFGWSDKEFNNFSKGAVNLIPVHRGWHERVAKNQINHALVSFSDLIKIGDATYGLRIFASLFTQKPSFASQTKEKLSWAADISEDFETKLYKVIKEELAKVENGNAVQAVIRKIVSYKKKLEALSDADYINSVVRKGSDKRKKHGVGIGLSDCTYHGKQSELYIVEGQSAAEFVRYTRNIRTQAVLPLQGKVLNVIVKDDVKSILENKEMELMINTIGAGAFNDVDISAMRYGKILIAADADADGAQISNLILGALTYIIPEVVKRGYVYEVIAPLYAQKGQYFYNLNSLQKNKPFERFKGLGSMDMHEIEKTIVNPKTRHLRQIILDDRQGIVAIMQKSSEKKKLMLQGGIIKERS